MRKKRTIFLSDTGAFSSPIKKGVRTSKNKGGGIVVVGFIDESGVRIKKTKLNRG